MHIAIIGRPGVGKSTILRVLAEQPGLTADKAVLTVKDERLYRIGEIFKSKTITPLHYELVDTHKLDLTNSSIRDADALILVVGGFIPGCDVKKEIQDIEGELILEDYRIAENRLTRLNKEHSKTTSAQQERHLLEKILQHLEGEKPLRAFHFEKGEEKLIRGFSFLSLKPLIAIINTEDVCTIDTSPYPSITIPAKLEEELLDMEGGERETMAKELGIDEMASRKFPMELAKTMGLITFFTANQREARAWQVKQGTTAKESAGKIHSHMERGFIRAQVISYEDLVSAGSVEEAKKQNLWRTEGKDYIVQDGDIIQIRFSV